MKKFTYQHTIWVALQMLLFIAFLPAFAQDEPVADDGNKPVRPPFECTWIIDNQTPIVPVKGTLEFMIQHRFGSVSENGISDLWGLYAPSNIRLALSYTLFEKLGIGSLRGPLAIGIGTTKDNRIQDVNFKYAFLQQTRNSRIPVSITYFGDVGIETLNETEDLPNGNPSDRLSFFHQLIISRRFSEKISIQLAPSISHYNVVEPGRSNDHIAIAVAARYKFTPQSSLLVNIDQPITDHESGNPFPNISFGIEVSTGSHAFQVFVTNFSAIIPQRNNFYNPNDYKEDGFRIGFNINRLWNF